MSFFCPCFFSTSRFGAPPLFPPTPFLGPAPQMVISLTRPRGNIFSPHPSARVFSGGNRFFEFFFPSVQTHFSSRLLTFSQTTSPQQINRSTSSRPAAPGRVRFSPVPLSVPRSIFHPPFFLILFRGAPGRRPAVPFRDSGPEATQPLSRSFCVQTWSALQFAPLSLFRSGTVDKPSRLVGVLSDFPTEAFPRNPLSRLHFSFNARRQF